MITLRTRPLNNFYAIAAGAPSAAAILILVIVHRMVGRGCRATTPVAQKPNKRFSFSPRQRRFGTPSRERPVVDGPAVAPGTREINPSVGRDSQNKTKQNPK